MTKRALLGYLLFLLASSGPAMAQVGGAETAQDLPTILRDLNTAMENATRGAVAHWRNPETGNSGTITPLWTFISKEGRPCRQYERTWSSAYRTIKFEGSACRAAPGDWLVRQEGVTDDYSHAARPAPTATTDWTPPQGQQTRGIDEGLEGAARAAAIAQRDLRELGYDPGPIDGVVGSRTTAAIRAFQADCELPVTGEIDTALIERLAAEIDARRNPASSADQSKIAPSAAEQQSAAADKIAEPTPNEAQPVEVAAPSASEPAPSEPAASEPAVSEPADEAPAEQVETEAPPLDDSTQAERDRLSEAQRHLDSLGYAPGRTDGVNGPRTVGAIMRFQRVHGLEMTGKVDDSLAEMLRTVAAEHLPSQAPETGRDETEIVLAIQERLHLLGYAPGPIDGVVGERTRAAAAAYQMDRGRTPVQSLDESLLAALVRDYADMIGGSLSDDGAEPPEAATTEFKDYFARDDQAPPLAEKVPDLILDSTRQNE